MWVNIPYIEHLGYQISPPALFLGCRFENPIPVLNEAGLFTCIHLP